jgi:putative ABC transport system substrate-binding protein
MPDVVVAELVNMNVRAIVTGPNTFIDVAKQVTSTMPIVMLYATDPVGHGNVGSLYRPGRNITGLAWDTIDCSG